jgi:hypothetical protein
VRFAETRVKSFANHVIVFHDHASHHRVGLDISAAVHRQAESAPQKGHITFIHRFRSYGNAITSENPEFLAGNPAD